MSRTAANTNIKLLENPQTLHYYKIKIPNKSLFTMPFGRERNII